MADDKPKLPRRKRGLMKRTLDKLHGKRDVQKKQNKRKGK